MILNSAITYLDGEMTGKFACVLQATVLVPSKFNDKCKQHENKLPNSSCWISNFALLSC